MWRAATRTRPKRAALEYNLKNNNKTTNRRRDSMLTNVYLDISVISKAKNLYKQIVNFYYNLLYISGTS